MSNQIITPQTVQQLNNKEEQAYKIVFYALYRLVHVIAYKIVYDHTAAEEIAIDAFSILFRHSQPFSDERHIKNTVEKITVRLALNSLKSRTRRSKRYKELTENESEEQDQSENRNYTDEQIKILHGLVKELPGQCKEVIYCYLTGLSSKQTAAKLGMSVSNVDAQKHRGVKLLRKKMFNE